MSGRDFNQMRKYRLAEDGFFKSFFIPLSARA